MTETKGKSKTAKAAKVYRVPVTRFVGSVLIVASSATEARRIARTGSGSFDETDCEEEFYGKPYDDSAMYDPEEVEALLHIQENT